MRGLLRMIWAVLFFMASAKVMFASPAVWSGLQKTTNGKYSTTWIGAEKVWKQSPEKFVLSIPNPQGSMDEFVFEQNTVLPEALKLKYQALATYTGVATKAPHIVAKMTIFEDRLNVYVFNKQLSYVLQPIDDNTYELFYKNTQTPPNTHRCLHKGESQLIEHLGTVEGLQTIGTITNIATRKIYRLALSCTYQYAVAVTGNTAPTKAQVLAAMAVTINRVNGIYERDLGISLQLIPNNDTLIFTSNSNAVFTNNNSFAMLSENRSFINARVGLSNYDIGHAFSTGAGGLATLGCVCTAYKAEGVTGTSQPFNDPFDVDYVAHEIGHQLGAEHSFNACENEERFSAYEPGSGATVMGYAGICGTNDLQNNSDDYFHLNSKKEILEVLTSPSLALCGTSSGSSVVIDTFSFNAIYNIPALTPFELDAPAGLVAQTYNWVQWNLGNFRSPEASAASFVHGPNLRSFHPTASGTRIFPQLDSLLVNNLSYRGERMSTVSRNLYFKLDLMNMDGSWGSSTSSKDSVVVRLDASGTPFRVTVPNAANAVWVQNDSTTIRWNVGVTDVMPINCQDVNIFLSRDGGYNYTDTLAWRVPNTGTYRYFVPDTLPLLSSYRVKIKGYENIFFDISDANFKVDTVPGPMSVISPSVDVAVSLYPNPVNTHFWINTDQDDNYQINIFDVAGRLVYHTRFAGKQGYIAPGGALLAGNYTLVVLNRGNVTIHRQIITKLP